MRKVQKIIFLAIGLLLCAGYAAYNINRIERNNAVETNKNKLFLALDVYRNMHGKYPSDITNIISMYSDLDEKDRQLMIADFNDMLFDNWGNKYEYLKLGDGFEIHVTGPDVLPMRWLGKQFKVELVNRPVLTNVTKP